MNGRKARELRSNCGGYIRHEKRKYKEVTVKRYKNEKGLVWDNVAIWCSTSERTRYQKMKRKYNKGE
jgi:hypothetical protein